MKKYFSFVSVVLVLTQLQASEQQILKGLTRKKSSESEFVILEKDDDQSPVYASKNEDDFVVIGQSNDESPKKDIQEKPEIVAAQCVVSYESCDSLDEEEQKALLWADSMARLERQAREGKRKEKKKQFMPRRNGGRAKKCIYKSERQQLNDEKQNW